MNFWIAYAVAFVAWWLLYFFVPDRMTDLGIGWINAMDPQSEAQYSPASKLTIAKHIIFAVLMIAALAFLARHYPSYRHWAYGLGLTRSRREFERRMNQARLEPGDLVPLRSG